MKALPLYPQLPQAPIATEEPEAHDDECLACPHMANARHVCMRPEGKSGGVLIVGEWPGKVEDQTGRPFYGAHARYVRDAVKKFWDGPVAYDYALRCAPTNVKKTKVKDQHLDACRRFGAKVLDDVRPERIICLGPAAFYAVLGRRPAQLSVRGGYGWVIKWGRWIPVFLVMSPALIMGNRFVRDQFEVDMENALTCKLPTFPADGARTVLVRDGREADRAALKLLQSDWITYDVETHGRLHNPDFRLESVTVLGARGRKAYTWTREALRDKVARAALARVLTSRDSVTQNGKYDEQAVMCDLGVEPRALVADTRLMRKLLDPEASATLELLAELVGMGGHKEEAQREVAEVCKELKRIAALKFWNPLTPTGKKRKPPKPPRWDVPESTLQQLRDGTEPMAFAYGYVSARTLYRYNALDVWSTREVYRHLTRKMTPEADRMWREVLRDASRAIRWIEHWGFAADRAAITQFAEYCEGRLAEAKKRLDRYGEVNWNSPKQLAELMFVKLKLPVVKETDSGLPSTDDDVLEALKGKHPLVDDLRVWRKYSKLNGTYARGMLIHVRGDGRIHPSFLLDGAGTGRLSCSDPNLQNIPRAKGDADAKFARSCFVAPPGYSIFEVDFSQLELRIAAMLSQDEVMIGDFKQGIDIHRNNARECCFVWGFTPEKWDKLSKDDQDPYRSQIKTLTFGRLYGKTMKGMARELGCSVQQVEAIDKRIWGRYKRLDAWIKEQLRKARQTGEAWTWWNGERARRRPITKIGSQDEGLRKHAERTSWNTPIQGTAAEFCTASLWPIVRAILEDAVPAKVVCTVHDSILIEVRDDAIDEIAALVHNVMTGWPSMGVPITVEMKVGKSWGDLHDYHLNVIKMTRSPEEYEAAQVLHALGEGFELIDEKEECDGEEDGKQAAEEAEGRRDRRGGVRARRRGDRGGGSRGAKLAARGR